MSAKLQAADDIKKFARSLKGLLAFAEELEKAGSFEQAMNETKARLESLRASEEVAKKDLAAVLAKKSEAEAAAEAVMLEAGQKADALLAQVAEEASAIKADVAQKCEAALRAANESKAAVQAEIDQAKEELAKLAAAVAEKSAQLDALNASLKALKEKLG